MIGINISSTLNSTTRAIGALFNGRVLSPSRTPEREVDRTRSAQLPLHIHHRDENDVATLEVWGDIGPRTYHELITSAKAARAKGQHSLVVDMAGVTRLGVTGIFALHNVMRIFDGRDLLDPEMGWSALGQISDQAPQAAPSAVRLVNLQPAVARVWQSVSGS